MITRKIQMVGGSTYSISLPKTWVLRNNLDAKSEIAISESGETLKITPLGKHAEHLTYISLDVDVYKENIEQVLFAVYYIGIENITLSSKKDISKDSKLRIKRAVANMSGTEITHEDSSKIIVKVLLDKSKVSIRQLISRVSLIIDTLFSSLASEINIGEIRLSENEIDRLYHLMAKIVSNSLIDSQVLVSSDIGNISLIPSYFLISKKLEHIGDNISYMCEYIGENRATLPDKEIVLMLQERFAECTSYFTKSTSVPFQRSSTQEIEKMFSAAKKIKDKAVRSYTENIIRLIDDIEEEITNISFYSQLIRDGAL